MKDFREAISKPREIALYTMTDSNSLLPLSVSYTHYDENFQPLPEGQQRESPISGFVRVSEPVTVQFAPIDNDTMVRNAVEALNAEERKTIDELNTKLAQIRERKQQLLALTHEPAEAV